MSNISVARDIEALAVQALNDRLPDKLTAHTKIPTKDGQTVGEFVRVIGVGGTGIGVMHDSYRLMVEGWADAEARAQHLCAIARGILTSQDTLIRGGVGLGVPANDPHPDYPAKARYACEVLVYARAELMPL